MHCNMKRPSVAVNRRGHSIELWGTWSGQLSIWYEVMAHLQLYFQHTHILCAIATCGYIILFISISFNKTWIKMDKMIAESGQRQIPGKPFLFIITLDIAITALFIHCQRQKSIMIIINRLKLQSRRRNTPLE